MSSVGRGLGSSSMLDATPIVFVVDDDISVRESLELLLRFQGWQPETFPSAQEFLARPRAFVPSCLILDVGLPDLNGLDLQNRIAGDRKDMPIIFITGRGDVPMTVRAMKAGKRNRIFDQMPFNDGDVLLSIRHALECSGGAALRDQAEMQALQSCQALLTNREREVMSLVATGLLNKQVGIRLGISEITVKAHRGKGNGKDESRLPRRSGQNGRQARSDGRIHTLKFPETQGTQLNTSGVIGLAKCILGGDAARKGIIINLSRPKHQRTLNEARATSPTPLAWAQLWNTSIGLTITWNHLHWRVF